MAQKKKRGKPSGGGGGGGGGLLGMRSGFRRMVGVEKGDPKRRASPVWNVVSWVAILALLVVAGFVVYRRFGG